MFMAPFRTIMGALGRAMVNVAEAGKPEPNRETRREASRPDPVVPEKGAPPRPRW